MLVVYVCHSSLAGVGTASICPAEGLWEEDKQIQLGITLVATGLSEPVTSCPSLPLTVEQKL